MIETIAYLDKIDAAYANGKLRGLSRYSTQWGIFSRDMNLEIRNKIESNHPEKLLLKMIVGYWLNRSIMLEIYFERKNKIRKNRLRFLSKDCDRIRKDISKSKSNQSDMLTMVDIARMSLQGESR